MDPLQKKGRISFRQGIKKNEISDGRTKKRHLVPPQSKQNKQRGNIFIYFVSFWRHGRAVRWGTANPFSPVQIWVSPDQQKIRLVFCLAGITRQIFSSKTRVGKRLLRLS